MMATVEAMGCRHRLWRRMAVALCAMLPWCGPVGAHLGGDLAAVEADALQLQGAVQRTALIAYDVQEITAAAGLTVREYVTRSGTVFAVTWSGPVPPDLAQLLGSHFARYLAGFAAQEHPGLKRSLRIATPDLIVESGGHLRAFSGRAYLPALLPAGVQVADLR